MILKFKHNGKEIPVEYAGTGSGHAVLYAVPREYSSDGYYVSLWQDTELEPVPACAVAEAHALCRVRIERGNDGLVAKVVENEKGVSCNA